jgi:hypothetical protein
MRHYLPTAIGVLAVLALVPCRSDDGSPRRISSMPRTMAVTLLNDVESMWLSI